MSKKRQIQTLVLGIGFIFILILGGVFFFLEDRAVQPKEEKDPLVILRKEISKETVVRHEEFYQGLEEFALPPNDYWTNKNDQDIESDKEQAGTLFAHAERGHKKNQSGQEEQLPEEQGEQRINSLAIPKRPTKFIAPKSDQSIKIAIVIDDLGLNPTRLGMLLALADHYNVPLNLAFLPYATNLAMQTGKALLEGHELLVHVPMMPQSRNQDLGPIVLQSDMSEQEITEALITGLNSFKGYKGINNHMGSAFTEDLRGMKIVMHILKERGLYFMDSRTTSKTVGYELAKAIGVPSMQRDIFLDHKIDQDFIHSQLEKTEEIARTRGWAIAIGHPYPQTIETIKEWLSTLQEKNIELVTLSHLMDRPFAQKAIAVEKTAEKKTPSVPVNTTGQMIIHQE